LTRCHLCSRMWHPSSRPCELFRHHAFLRVAAPHHMGAWNRKYPNAASAKAITTASPMWRRRSRSVGVCAVLAARAARRAALGECWGVRAYPGAVGNAGKVRNLCVTAARSI